MGAHTDSRPSQGATKRSSAPEPRHAQNASSVSSEETNELLESLGNLDQQARGGSSREALVETVKRFARTMQQRVAKLGGVVSGQTTRTSGPPAQRPSLEPRARNSMSNSLDGYRPDRDVVAPISVRPNGMELLWVCGDCGQHYPRARDCPEVCSACGAPKQHFYAPIED